MRWANDLAANSDDLAFASFQKISNISIVFHAIRRRHQQLDVFMPDFASAVLEQPFAGRIEHQYPAAGIDQDNPVHRSLDDSLKPCVALAQRPFDPFALGQVVDDSDKDRSIVLPGFADREVHGKSGAVLALTEHLAADADDFSFAGAVKIVEVKIMLLAVWPRHQHLDVLTDHLMGWIFEQLFARGIEHQHGATGIDQDDAIDRGFHDGPQPFRFSALGPGFGFISQRFST